MKKLLDLFSEEYPNKVLEEDECAPDAFEYFEKDFVLKTKISVDFFCKSAEAKVFTQRTNIWVRGDFMLEFSADDPVHKLYTK